MTDIKRQMIKDGHRIYFGGRFMEGLTLGDLVAEISPLIEFYGKDVKIIAKDIGCSNESWYVQYEREETDQEVQERIRSHLEENELRKMLERVREKKERKELARLLKKYGENVT